MIRTHGRGVLGGGVPPFVRDVRSDGGEGVWKIFSSMKEIIFLNEKGSHDRELPGNSFG